MYKSRTCIESTTNRKYYNTDTRSALPSTMAGISNHRFDTSNPTANDTVTAIVTRTITTTNADDYATTVYSSTDSDVKSVIVGREPELAKDTFLAETPVSVMHVEHTKSVITESLGLNGNDSLELGSGETTADIAVQQLLSSMLRSGLKPKGPNNKPVVPVKLSSNNDPMRPNTQGNK
ncbi:hypothetical protein BC629DRAFT_1486060 [Irpex lacteus]|nr:hypothetical protein BC629DRAFT_1486060 [Irpex lacteus]